MTAPLLIITRGLPGSGKTMRAREWVAADPLRRCRVNRDDVRLMLHGGRLGTADQEKQVTVAQHATVAALLAKGLHVIVDDTNLRLRYARELRRLADRAGAGFEVWDLTDVPLETCLERDAARVATVGEAVIRDMYTRFVRGQRYPLPFPDDPDDPADESAPAALYVPPDGAPSAVIVDIDGTTALMVARSPFDETRVHEDRPNASVIAAVRAMHAAGHRVVFCSGRTEGCREATEKWLAEHVAVPYDGLFMRAVGDQRKDSVVKAELFDANIRHRYNVVAVFDDRGQVVARWRSMGLTVFQVADGDF